MKTRKLGNLEVSAIGFGCMGMTHACGAPADTREMTELLAQAVACGYTFFDTAECYTGVNADGSTAYNEELVGEGKTARIEVAENDQFNVWSKRDMIVPAILEAGFDHVALDLEGAGGRNPKRSKVVKKGKTTLEK